MPTVMSSAPDTATSATTQLVVFLLGGDEYALPIDVVKEVVQYTRPRQVRSADPGITGVISLRGKITPVYDLAARLGLSAAGQNDGRKIVILEADQGTSGLIVDAVSQITTLPCSQVEQHASVDRRLVSAIAKLEDDKLVVLLNPTAFVPEGNRATQTNES